MNTSTICHLVAVDACLPDLPTLLAAGEIRCDWDLGLVGPSIHPEELEIVRLR